MTVLMHGLIRLYHGGQVRLLKEFWKQGERDLVVSLIPNFNRALRESLPATPLVTILTDLADFPPHFWIERQDQYLICGTEKAVEQARALGHPAEHIFRDLGNDFAPELLSASDGGSRGGTVQAGPGSGAAHRPGAVRRARFERDAGNRETRHGRSPSSSSFADGTRSSLQRLRGMPTKFPKYVEEFTSEIPYYMHLSDFFVGKPGPGSISEAIAMRLPVVVERNAWTLPQERYNTEWILREAGGRGVAIVPRDRRRVARVAGRGQLRPVSRQRSGHHEPRSF